MRHITSTHYSQSYSTNDSVGWLPMDHHLLVLLQRPQQQQQQQHVLLQHSVLLQYTLLQHPLSSKHNASTSSYLEYFGGGLPRYSSSRSPHPRFDIDILEGERRCNFRSEDVSYLGLLNEVAPAVPSAGRTRARTSCCLHRRDGKECCLYAHNGTKALIRHLHKASYYIIHPRRFARNASYERSYFWRITTHAHPKKL